MQRFQLRRLLLGRARQAKLAARRRHGIDLPYGPAAEKALLAAAGGGGPPDDDDDSAALYRHLGTGRPLGDDAFIGRLEADLGRVLRRRRPGPRRHDAADAEASAAP